jgi:hypothetical protein
MQLQNATDFKVSTSSFWNVLRATSALDLDEFLYVLPGALIEAIAYCQARTDLSKDLIPYIWEPIESTKIQL